MWQVTISDIIILLFLPLPRTQIVETGHRLDHKKEKRDNLILLYNFTGHVSKFEMVVKILDYSEY